MESLHVIKCVCVRAFVHVCVGTKAISMQFMYKSSQLMSETRFPILQAVGTLINC